MVCGWPSVALLSVSSPRHRLLHLLMLVGFPDELAASSERCMGHPGGDLRTQVSLPTTSHGPRPGGRISSVLMVVLSSPFLVWLRPARFPLTMECPVCQLYSCPSCARAEIVSAKHTTSPVYFLFTVSCGARPAGLTRKRVTHHAECLTSHGIQGLSVLTVR